MSWITSDSIVRQTRRCPRSPQPFEISRFRSIDASSAPTPRARRVDESTIACEERALFNERAISESTISSPFREL